MLLISAVAAAVTAGCQPLGSEQMARVAKDWSLAMRANQMIPVYPLSEDIEPGDVYLVQRSVGEQQKEYEERGFLALDDHRHRIGNIAYNRMYFDGYWKDGFATPPAHARSVRLANAGGGAGMVPAEVAAPRVAFPTYTFEVSRSGGLSVAVPVEAIPVGFNFLGADKATGTVTLMDAHSYAADTYDLDKQLRTWVRRPEVLASLREASGLRGQRPLYLRVVSRVYLVGEVNVSLTRAGSAGANVTAGTNAPAVQPVDANGNVNANYQALLDSLGKQVNLAKVGGAVQFTQASSQGVSMNEVFDHPLVIGYLGFDVAVDEYGNLGPRVPTFDVLERRAAPRPLTAGQFSSDERSNAVRHAAFRQMLGSEPNGVAQALQVIEAVGENIDDESLTKDARQAKALLRGAANPAAISPAQAKSVVDAFENDWDVYVSKSGDAGRNYAIFGTAFDRAFIGDF